MVKLDLKSSEEFTTWLPGKKDQYIAERIKAGENPEAASKMSELQFAQLFPGGSPAEGQYVMNVIADEVTVGTLWMGRPFSGEGDTWFIFDIEISKDSRGRGYGRAAMEAAEEWTRARGGTRVALNVFGPNLTARSLYDSLGYEVLATSMFKDI
ncbi:MAG: GNAT family N-acetyltransferase [Acidimicrobiales bacterium]|jgi:ribosomal protein S18 acetylase RimI-like enzyme